MGRDFCHDPIPFWRVYADSEEDSFTLHLANVFASANPSYGEYFGFSGSDELHDDNENLLALCYQRENAIKLRLYQPDRDKDEYYLQSADDGRYVAIADSKERSRWTSFELINDLSEAALFGLTQCVLPCLHRLKMGQRVLFRARCYESEWYDLPEAWLRGRVCERRHTEYGHEVRIAYSGTVIGYAGVKHERSGTSRWIPLTSYDIDFDMEFDERVLEDRLIEENACPETTAWNPYCRVELCDQVFREGEDRFYRKLKSQRKTKTGKRKGKNERSNANALRAQSRVRRKNKKYIKSITRRVFVS